MAEKNYNINAIVLASIAAAESGWGQNCFEPYNIFGFYSSNSFSSYEECIDYVASFLQRNYLTEGGCYFNGYSLNDINVYYNGSQHWIDFVSGIAFGIESNIG